MNKKIKTRENINNLVIIYDEEDWAQLMKREPEGYSWREEAYLAGEDYFEEGKEFLRSN